MLYLQPEAQNQVFVTCSRNKNLSNPTYLWTIRHKLSAQKWQFIPYKVPSSVQGYLPAYDSFLIDVYSGTAENFIASGGTEVNLHLLNGEYYLKIYEQLSSTNLNPSLAYDVVYEGMMVVNWEINNEEPPMYTGTSEVFIIYGS
jgi:hypothetical protein